MFVRVEFDSHADLSDEGRRMIEGTCLTLSELQNCGWCHRRLVYWTGRSASEVVADWESQGFSFDEFGSFHFYN